MADLDNLADDMTDGKDPHDKPESQEEDQGPALQI